MTKKRMLLLAVLPLTIALTLGVLAMLPPIPGVTKANFDRIEIGMTKTEVEQILGGKGSNEEGIHIWDADDESAAVIVFDANDAVSRKHWHDSGETFLAKIRRLLHLQ